MQNDAYNRLEKFVLLEKNNELEQAKKNPRNYDSMLRIDLQQFKNSTEFKDYLKSYDISVDRGEALFIGWLFSFLAEISMLCIQLIRYCQRMLRKRYAVTSTPYL